MLKRKMLRDLRIGKAQFLSIFCMCFLGMFMYSGIYGEWRGLQKEKSIFYEQSNLSDIWIQGNEISSEPLIDIEGIDAIDERTLLLGNDVNVQDSTLHCYITDTVNISKLQIIDGEAYDENVDGVWLDASYAQENSLHVGDLLQLEIASHTVSKEIKGLAYHPEYVYVIKDESALMPDHKTFGFVYMSFIGIPDFLHVASNQILIKSNEDSNVLKQKITEAYGLNVQVISASEHSSVRMLEDEIAQHKTIGTLFPIIFLLIAVLTTLNTMNKLIANQRVQIGTLKALGFQKRTLYAHYMSHSLLIACIGSILGTIMGPLCIPNLLYDMQKTMFILPVWKSYIDYKVLYLLIITIFFCSFACYVAMQRTLKENAAQSMRPKVIVIRQRVNYQVTSIWKKLNFYSQWNFRDIFRNKARSLMAIIGIGGCCALLACSLGFMDSIMLMIDDMYSKQHTYESKLNLIETASMSDISSLKQVVKGSLLYESGACISINDKEVDVPLTVMEDSKYIKLNIQDPTLPDDGIVVSSKLADQYNIKIGDKLFWKRMDDKTWKTSVVAQLADTPLKQGLSMHVNVYEEVGYTFQPSSILSSEKQLPENINVDTIQYREELYKNMEKMLETMQVLVTVLILAAVMLGIVVLYNVTSLSFFERTREMATLKVLGFSQANIVRLTRSQNLQLCTISILCGLPFGKLMINVIASTLSESMDMRPYISIYSYTIAIVFTFVITICISQWMARKSKSIDMVSALKSTE